jgi:hypothetical protein
MMKILDMEIVIKNQVMVPEVMRIYANELILFLTRDTSAARP